MEYKEFKQMDNSRQNERSGLEMDAVVVGMERLELGMDRQLLIQRYRERIQSLPVPKQNLVQHILLYHHSSGCGGCNSQNCQRMKELINHFNGCGGAECVLCQRMRKLQAYYQSIC